jgi:hypothetical protein
MPQRFVHDRRRQRDVSPAILHLSGSRTFSRFRQEQRKDRTAASSRPSAGASTAQTGLAFIPNRQIIVRMIPFAAPIVLGKAPSHRNPKPKEHS